jgi:hypothetical protein
MFLLVANSEKKKEKPTRRSVSEAVGPEIASLIQLSKGRIYPRQRTHPCMDDNNLPARSSGRE